MSNSRQQIKVEKDASTSYCHPPLPYSYHNAHHHLCHQKSIILLCRRRPPRHLNEQRLSNHYQPGRIIRPHLLDHKSSSFLHSHRQAKKFTLTNNSPTNPITPKFLWHGGLPRWRERNNHQVHNPDQHLLLHLCWHLAAMDQENISRNGEVDFSWRYRTQFERIVQIYSLSLRFLDWSQELKSMEWKIQQLNQIIYHLN